MELFSSVSLFIALGVIAVAALVVLLVSRSRRHRRTRELRERFGPEYDRTVARSRTRAAAEDDLEDRWDRHQRLRLRDLGAAERQALVARWDDVQASFVDGPESAVRNAEVILDEAARARGYPDASGDDRLDDLSIAHSDEVDAYRRASHPTDRKGRDAAPDAETLRRELLAARALFDALVGGPGDADRGATPAAPFEPIADADQRTESPTESPSDDAGGSRIERATRRDEADRDAAVARRGPDGGADEVPPSDLPPAPRSEVGVTDGGADAGVDDAPSAAPPSRTPGVTEGQRDDGPETAPPATSNHLTGGIERDEAPDAGPAPQAPFERVLGDGPDHRDDAPPPPPPVDPPRR